MELLWCSRNKAEFTRASACLQQNLPDAHRAFSERPCQQVLLKEGAKRLNGGLINRGKKARERRAMRQTVALEQGHERWSKWPQTIVKRFEGCFPAESIPDENGDKIDRLIATEAMASKANLLCNGLKETESCKMVHDDGDLAKP